MFYSIKVKIALGVFVVLILTIPVGAYFLSQRQEAPAATPKKDLGPVTKAPPSASPKSLVGKSTEKTASSSSSPAVSFGPTMNLKLVLEGRPAQNQIGKVFVGIAEGATVSAKPNYLLSFSIDLPADGIFNGLSLAGLTAGNNYLAILKGSAQIATSAAFAMSPSVTNLNNGQPIKLLTGDLNEDNAINTADFAIAKAAIGAMPNSPKWNDNVDFNKDGIINSADLSYILKNFGKIGDSGSWSSTPATGTPSATLIEASSSASASGSPTGGYWLWVPAGF